MAGIAEEMVKVLDELDTPIELVAEFSEAQWKLTGEIARHRLPDRNLDRVGWSLLPGKITRGQVLRIMRERELAEVAS